MTLVRRLVLEELQARAAPALQDGDLRNARARMHAQPPSHPAVVSLKGAETIKFLAAESLLEEADSRFEVRDSEPDVVDSLDEIHGGGRVLAVSQAH